jgi:AcrR family transcriptional regulator
LGNFAHWVKGHAGGTLATVTLAVGLRERKKSATRQALHEAALRLAVERGLENVTTEAIADAANVSRRTFSNYFEGKEDAVLYGDIGRLHLLLALLRARPAGEPGWSALRGSLHDLDATMSAPDRHWSAATRRLRRHPLLLARQVAAHAGFERDLVRALRDRSAQDPLTPLVHASMFLTALRVGTQLWLDDPTAETLLEATDRVLDQAGRAFS